MLASCRLPACYPIFFGGKTDFGGSAFAIALHPADW
jgi:hypothetical protein